MIKIRRKNERCGLVREAQFGRAAAEFLDVFFAILQRYTIMMG
jgi:hypothetical protein